MKSLWSRNFIEVSIKSNKNFYRVYTIDSKEYSSVFIEIFSDKQYKPIENMEDVRVVVDLGANIGLFAIYCNSYHRNAKLICLEPEPKNFELLERNIKINDINAIVLKKAIITFI